MTRSEEDRFADILNAVARCQSYEPYLRSDELGSMAYDAVLRNLGVIGEAGVIADGRDVKEIAAQCGVSRQTMHACLAMYESGG